MLNLVQEQQQADTVRDAIEEEIKKTSGSENPWVTMCISTGDMAESSEQKIEMPESISSNWILKDIS